MSLIRVIEQTKENSLITGQQLLWEISIGGLKIILGENPLQFINKATDFSGSPLYPEGRSGEMYVCDVAGTVGAGGGSAGKSLSVGDVLLCLLENDGGDEPTVGTNWIVLRSSTTVDGIVDESAAMAIALGGLL